MNNSHPSMQRRQAEKTSAKMLSNNFFKLVSWHLFKSFCNSDFITIFFAFHLAMLHKKKEENFCSSQKKCAKSLTIFHVTITIPISMSAWLHSKTLVAICVLFDFCILKRVRVVWISLSFIIRCTQKELCNDAILRPSHVIQKKKKKKCQ